MGYVQQVALLRGVGHVKFAYVGFEILNSNISVEESRITMRWRIRGISGLRVSSCLMIEIVHKNANCIVIPDT